MIDKMGVGELIQTIFAKWPKNSKFSRSNRGGCTPFTTASYHQKQESHNLTNHFKIK